MTEWHLTELVLSGRRHDVPMPYCEAVLTYIQQLENMQQTPWEEEAHLRMSKSTVFPSTATAPASNGGGKCRDKNMSSTKGTNKEVEVENEERNNYDFDDVDTPRFVPPTLLVHAVAQAQPSIPTDVCDVVGLVRLQEALMSMDATEEMPTNTNDTIDVSLCDGPAGAASAQDLLYHTVRGACLSVAVVILVYLLAEVLI